MKSLMLSQSSIYHLQKLSTLVKQKTGVRHQLADMKSTINLLRFSCTSPDELVHDYYEDFCSTLEEDQREYLQFRGLLMPATKHHLLDSGEIGRQAFQ